MFDSTTVLSGAALSDLAMSGLAFSVAPVNYPPPVACVGVKKLVLQLWRRGQQVICSAFSDENKIMKCFLEEVLARYRPIPVKKLVKN